MNRTAQSQGLHDQIVQAVANHVVQKGYPNVRAELPGFRRPDLISGTKQDHVPDVSAEGLVVEVETADTIDSEHTTSQWSLFSDFAAKSGREFWVVVPSGSEAAARMRLNALGSQGKVFAA